MSLKKTINGLDFSQTFASHPKSQFWSKRNEKGPNEYALNSHKKCWFDCECGHEFEMILKNINSRDSWCPYCCNKKLCGQCNICYNKSFASNNMSKFLSNENKINPLLITINSHKKYLFDCECGHQFEAPISAITCKTTWCPYCCKPPKRFCENDECIQCFNKKFASHPKAKYWSTKNKLKPNQVFKNTATKFWFDCEKCNNNFESKLCHIVSGSWCPKCRYKTENKIENILKEIDPLLARQVKFNWCKNIKHLPFDFVLEHKKIIIEIDGIQHWSQVAKWKSPQHNRIRDLFKMKCANENGFSIIRILQDDVFHDKYNWLQELLINIDKIVNEKRVQNIYMCKKDEYKDFDV